MFYSKSTNGFYDDPQNYKNFPEDAVEISADVYDEVVRFRPAGKMVAPDANGYPILIDEPKPVVTPGQIAQLRQAAYRQESDPLFMEWQYDRDPGSETAWRDKVMEIKARFPMPEA